MVIGLYLSRLLLILMDVAVKLVFEPEWDKSRMSEEAMLELGLL